MNIARITWLACGLFEFSSTSPGAPRDGISVHRQAFPGHNLHRNGHIGYRGVLPRRTVLRVLQAPWAPMVLPMTFHQFRHSSNRE
jgi:hypothetical protein